MGFLLGQVIAFAIASAIYVFLLRLSSKWTLGYKLSSKLAWIWCGLALVLTVVNIALAAPLAGPPPIVFGAGLLLHIALGGAFFGNFAVDQSKAKPGFVKGVALVGAAVAMGVVIFGGLVVGSTFLLSRMG